MKVLCVDTSTATTSVAVVATPGGAKGAEFPLTLAALESAADIHSSHLLSLIQTALRRAGIELAEIEAYAVGRGPGSFTGLRIGMTTAKGLAFATERPLWMVSSLAALASDLLAARGDAASALLVPTLHARRGEIFAGFYRGNEDGIAPVSREGVFAPERLAETVAALTARGDPVLLAGEGVAAFPAVLARLGARAAAGRQTPSAVSVGRLALAGDRSDALEHGVPTYLRAPAVKQPPSGRSPSNKRG